jgi:galactonate dehydratase
MRITRFETLMANAGLRNYLFIRLHTDNGLTGVGEASLEWQEKTVQTFAHEWLEERVLGTDPFDIERTIGHLIRDQYQGGATAMTAISGVEIAMWDLVGKACHQPVFRLIGGRYHRELPAYCNGWYGAAQTPADYADRAREAVARGYRALKFDPFDTAWKELSDDALEQAVERVAAVRAAIGPQVRLFVEFHGRLSFSSALAVIRRLEPFAPAWCEEPIAPEKIELLSELKRQVTVPIAAGERLYTIDDFDRLVRLRAADVVQMDVAHCGGIMISKKIAAIAAVQDIRIAPHCSIGPVALAAALHVDISTPNFMIQETFSDFDVPWRDDLVRGWNPVRDGSFVLSDEPGLGLELDDDVIAAHAYRAQSFPSLWNEGWLEEFSQDVS